MPTDDYREVGLTTGARLRRNLAWSSAALTVDTDPYADGNPGEAEVFLSPVELRALAHEAAAMAAELERDR